MAGIFFSDVKNENGINRFKEIVDRHKAYQKIEDFSNDSVYIGLTNLDGRKRIFSNDEYVVAVFGFVVIGEETICSGEKLYEKIRNVEFSDIHKIITTGSFNILVYNIKKKRILFINDRYNYLIEYYYKDDDKLIISDRVENILHSLQRRLTVNMDSVEDIICLGHLTLDNTFFKDISTIPSATYMIYDLEDRLLVKEKYWSFTEYKDKHSVDVDDLYKRLEIAMERLPRGKNEIVFLSGGMDSRLVYAMSDCKDSITIGKKNCSEIKFIKKFQKVNSNNITIDLFTPDKINPYWDETLYETECMISQYNTLHCLLQNNYVRKMGYDTGLTGFLGDAVIGGTLFFNIEKNFSDAVKNIFFGYHPPPFSKKEAVKYAFEIMSGRKIKRVRDLDTYIELFDQFDIPTTIEWTQFLNRLRRLYGHAMFRDMMTWYEPFWDYDVADLCLSMHHRERAWRRKYIELFRKKLPDYCSNSTSTGGLPLNLPFFVIRISSYGFAMMNIILKHFGKINSYIDINEVFNDKQINDKINEKLTQSELIKNNYIESVLLNDILNSGNVRLIMNLYTLEHWLKFYNDFIDVNSIDNVPIKDWYCL